MNSRVPTMEHFTLSIPPSSRASPKSISLRCNTQSESLHGQYFKTNLTLSFWRHIYDDIVLYLTLRLRGSLELKRTLFGLMSRWQTRALCRYSRASASWRKELVGLGVEFLACLRILYNVATIFENMKTDLNIDYLCDDNTTLCLREFIVHGRKSGKEISSCSISLIQTWISNFSKQK